MHEVKKRMRLLDGNGNIAEPGYAKKLYWKYSRKDIKAPKWRIKEWDYYYIGCQEYGLALTISDAGYVSSLSASLLGFGAEPFQLNDGDMGMLPLGRLHLPPTSRKGDVSARAGRAGMAFYNDGQRRHLVGSISDFAKSGCDLTFDITLTDFPEESMVIATPFDQDKHFYYNQKINGMRADGVCRFGGKEYRFNAANGSCGTLDWGRGVWTYDNTWYWGSGQAVLGGGDIFGFNIGYGFGNTSAATENMLFYNGKAHKLKDVRFQIPEHADGTYAYMEPWTFTETDGRFEMRFEPVLDRQAPVDLKVICMVPHQVFGRMYGTAVLDDGKKVTLDGQMVFAEHVHNKW